MKTLHVGVSGVNAIDNPGPGIGVARSLKEQEEFDVTIVGLAYDAMDPGNYMGWVVDRTFVMPYPSASGEAFLERLGYIRSVCGLDVIIPSLDAELPFYIHYADALRAMGIEVFLPSMEQFRLRGKDRLGAVADAIGAHQPETRVVTTAEELVKAVADLGAPVMVKGVFYDAHAAYSEAEALEHFHRIAAAWGYPIIVQRIVGGEHLNVIGLGDGDGGTLGLVGIRKLTMTGKGKIWTGVTVHHEPMLEAARRFVSAYNWRGPFELECIVEGEQVHLIEINPRFPAWVYFATGVGVNLPHRLLSALYDPAPREAVGYEAGKLFVRYTSEIVTDMESFQTLVTLGESA